MGQKVERARMLVQEFLERSAARLPQKVALICDGQRLTYHQVNCMANRLAHTLVEKGVLRGDRVVLYLNNTVELVVGIFAVLKAGGVFVVVNPTTKKDKLVYILNNAGAAGLISSDLPAAPLAEIAAKAPGLRIVIEVSREKKDAHFLTYESIQSSTLEGNLPKKNIDLDLACLIYTSGSTGDPKGVMSDHSNVDFATGSIITYLENREDDIVIDLLPLSFDYGLYQLLMVFKFGGTLVLEKGFAFPAAVLKKMQEEKVTGFPGVPTIFAVLNRMDLSSYDLSRLRYLSNTAAALPVSHIIQIQEKFPWAKLFSMYGLTETKRTLYLPPDQLETRPGSVGIAIPGTEVWLEDEDGRRLSPGETGELVVRGRHVMRGYWNEPEMTARRYRPGPIPGERLCYTNDLFRTDEDGYFYFVSRKDDIIKSRGEKVSPVEVERSLYAIPGVLEAAVIGIPDPVLGQSIKAFIVTDRLDLTRNEVLAHCKSQLDDFMVPQVIEFVPELPKTSSGKIKKTDLQ